MIKYIFCLPFVFLSVLTLPAQQLYIVPHMGINFGAFGYRDGGKDPQSILTFPKFNNLNYAFGADINYSKNNSRLVLTFSSLPFGISFNGNVKNPGTGQSSIRFAHSSYDRQFFTGLQLFRQSDKPGTKKRSRFRIFYGAGLGIGFNRSQSFYNLNNLPLRDGLSNGFDGYYFAYEATRKRENTGLYLLPEAGFTYYAAKKKPIINLSLYYYAGLVPLRTYNLTLQYGNINTGYFVEEKPVLRTNGSVFGIKISMPVKVFDKDASK